MPDKINILDSLYAAQDVAYRDFNSSLITTVDKSKFIGVRTPILRAMAHNIRADCTDFLKNLPHKYFEENQLHAFIISEFRDFDLAIGAVDKFLPYVDSWATCDQMSPKVFAKNSEKLLPYVQRWIKSKHVYTVRFAVLCLMRYWLKDGFDKKYANMVVGIKSDEYYINMMRAWYFATAMVNHFDEILPYMDKLDNWTRARTIQKALESYRISPQNKVKLKELKQKDKK